MRIWSLHPRYLDRQGLTACWRETLLAQAVLAERTRGYRNHPQLERFRAHPDPIGAITAYLHGIADEADARGYNYDRTRIDRPASSIETIPVTDGQLDLEWAWLCSKLRGRSPHVLSRWEEVERPAPHRSFHVVPGSVEPWERAVVD